MKKIDWNSPQPGHTFVHFHLPGVHTFHIKDGLQMHFPCPEDKAIAVIREAPVAAWDGEGLPPVGTVCEMRNAALGTAWAEATIVFASRNVIVWDWAGEPSINGLCAGYAHTVELRPIRTPEQIAADERNNSIEEMVSTSPMLDKGWARKVCTALYDAGYRKQVAP